MKLSPGFPDFSSSHDLLMLQTVAANLTEDNLRELKKSLRLTWNFATPEGQEKIARALLSLIFDELKEETVEMWMGIFREHKDVLEDSLEDFLKTPYNEERYARNPYDLYLKVHGISHPDVKTPAIWKTFIQEPGMIQVRGDLDTSDGFRDLLDKWFAQFYDQEIKGTVEDLPNGIGEGIPFPSSKELTVAFSYDEIHTVYTPPKLNLGRGLIVPQLTMPAEDLTWGELENIRSPYPCPVPTVKSEWGAGLIDWKAMDRVPKKFEPRTYESPAPIENPDTATGDTSMRTPECDQSIADICTAYNETKDPYMPNLTPEDILFMFECKERKDEFKEMFEYPDKIMKPEDGGASMHPSQDEQDIKSLIKLIEFELNATHYVINDRSIGKLAAFKTPNGEMKATLYRLDSLRDFYQKQRPIPDQRLDETLARLRKPMRKIILSGGEWISVPPEDELQKLIEENKERIEKNAEATFQRYRELIEDYPKVREDFSTGTSEQWVVAHKELLKGEALQRYIKDDSIKEMYPHQVKLLTLTLPDKVNPCKLDYLLEHANALGAKQIATPEECVIGGGSVTARHLSDKEKLDIAEADLKAFTTRRDALYLKVHGVPHPGANQEMDDLQAKYDALLAKYNELSKDK